MDSRNVLKLIAAHGAENVALVINYSGGKDSHRMLGALQEQFPNLPVYVVMADTGFEHVKPISAIDWARAAVLRYELPLHVVRNPHKTYLEMVERRGKFPSPSCRQCTSDLKRDPVAKFIRSIPQRVIVNCTGIRAEESPSRAKQKPWKLDRRLSRAGRTVWNWMPIFEEKLSQVLDWHWRNAQPLHPVYVPEYHADGTKGGWLRRFSCRVCIFATTEDLHAIYRHDREAFDIVANLEERIGFTMRPGSSLREVASVFNILQ